MKKLTARAVESIRKHGRHRCGENLYLQIGKDGRRSWVFRYQLGGKPHMLGLGPVDLVTLAEAREMAFNERRRLLQGGDPLQHKRTTRAQARLDAAKGVTFKECAEAYIKAHEAGWRNAAHRQQWRNTLAKYAYPSLGDLPVQQIDTGAVMKCLEPIWRERTETASRVRGRIEVVLDWAKVRGYRDGDTPARWRGHLDKLLPRRSKVRQVEHLAAMPYTSLPSFMAELRAQAGVVARALEFLILTAARAGEVLGARWSEINLPDKTWTVPAERMKAGEAHRVPLSQQAVELLRALPRTGDLIFPSPKFGRVLHLSQPLMVMRRLGRSETVHGFRSSFRDWAADTTPYPNHVVEQALAHAIPNAVEAAYRRGDMYAKRARLMEQWSTFCSSPPVERSDVVVALARQIGG